MARQRKRSRRTWGKVEPLPSGNYRASYTGPDKLRHFGPMTFTAVIDADAWLSTQRAQIVAGTWTPSTARDAADAQADRAQTLGTYAAQWITTRTNSKGDHLRPRTKTEYERLLRTPDADRPDDAGGPLAALVALPLIEITPARVRKWRADLLATGHKTQTSRAYGLLNAIMTTAIIDRIIDTNPCTVKGGQSTHTGRDVTPPTDAELETILATITPRYRALVALAAAGGLRFGEAIALRAQDVAVERAEDGTVVAVRVNVERGVSRTADGLVAGPPKTSAGVRRVAIFGDDAAIIAEHVRSLIGGALLFPATDGVSFLAQSAFWKHWNPARTAAGRADMPFHALRHYAGTRYAQQGATPRETMARLGHSSMGAAMRYQHSGNRDDELAARMARRTSA
jgi:integrase